MFTFWFTRLLMLSVLRNYSHCMTMFGFAFDNNDNNHVIAIEKSCFWLWQAIVLQYRLGNLISIITSMLNRLCACLSLTLTTMIHKIYIDTKSGWSYGVNNFWQLLYKLTDVQDFMASHSFLHSSMIFLWTFGYFCGLI